VVVDQLKAFLENEDGALLRCLLVLAGGLVALGALNVICSFLGKGLRVFNSVASLFQSLVRPAVLLLVFCAVLTGGAYLQLPWFVSAPAAIFLFIIGVGLVWTRR
jgi:hypothetical protein